MTEIPVIPNRTMAAGWRALHSCMLDSLLAQDEAVTVGVLDRIGGADFASFRRSLAAGEVLRVESARDEAGVLVFKLEVLSDNAGWVCLTHPPAELLGFDASLIGPWEDAFWDVRARRELGLDDE